MVEGSASQSILPLDRMAAAAAVGPVAGAPVASGATECSEGSAEGRLLDCRYRHRHLQGRLVAEGSVEAARAAEGKAETVGAKRTSQSRVRLQSAYGTPQCGLFIARVTVIDRATVV